MTSNCEFIIDGVVTGVSGVFHVIGRCGDVSIRLGDVFDQLDEPAGSPKPVNLRVVGIQAYQRSLEELEFGMTASIDVTGQGVDLLKPNSVLVASHPSSVADNKEIAVREATHHA